jgi:hypothetical protein
MLVTDPPMLETDSALLDLIFAPVLAGVFAFAFHYFRPMLETDSALFVALLVMPHP